MGCPCSLHLEAQSERAAHAARTATLSECDRLDRKYSHYRTDSLVAGIAANAGSVIELDEESANLLDFAAALHAQSEGLFDISAGSLTRLWDAQNGRLPTAEDIVRALQVTGWQHIEWQRPRLRLTLPGMRLDLGGIVKEYAADRCAQLCRDAGVDAGVVDLGGDLALIGPHRDGAPWIVGIKAPRVRDRASARIELPRGGLATSGDYERALIVDGRRYSHIVDPRTGEPVPSFASVSVVADSCLVAGAAATLAMLFGVERGGAYLRDLGLAHLCVEDNGRISGNIVMHSPESV
jgi:thiamine biosynthesis lipoprotein